MGSGFGLLLCKDLLLAQSEKLKINSAPNQGTTFTITLPHFEEKNSENESELVQAIV